MGAGRVQGRECLAAGRASFRQAANAANSGQEEAGGPEHGRRGQLAGLQRLDERRRPQRCRGLGRLLGALGRLACASEARHKGGTPGPGSA